MGGDARRRVRPRGRHDRHGRDQYRRNVPADQCDGDQRAGWTLTQLDALHDARQLRLADNASGLSWFEWLVLFVGAACVVGFCWLFGLANKRIHLIMTACVAILITSVLVLLYELQSPFRGDLAIGPNSWLAVMEHIQIMQSRPEVNMRM